MSYVPKVPDVPWYLIANLGKDMVSNYNAAQDRGIEEENRARYQALGPNASPQDLARASLQGGDSKGALAALGLAQNAEDTRAGRALDLLKLRATERQAAASLGQQQVTSGFRPGPGGVAETVPLGPADPRTIEARKAAEASSREPSTEDKKLIVQSEDMIASRQRAIDLLNEAEGLNTKAFSGGLASERGTIAANSPFPNVAPFPDRERGLATLRLDNILGKQALGHLRETFGGQPSNKEGEIQQRLEGARNQPAEIRAQIIQDAKKAAQDTIDIHKSRLEKLRAGTYFDPAGRPGSKSAAPVAPAGGGLVVPGAADKFTEGQIVTQKSTGKRFQMKGGQLVPYAGPTEE